MVEFRDSPAPRTEEDPLMEPIAGTVRGFTHQQVTGNAAPVHRSGSRTTLTVFPRAGCADTGGSDTPPVLLAAPRPPVRPNAEMPGPPPDRTGFPSAPSASSPRSFCLPSPRARATWTSCSGRAGSPSCASSDCFDAAVHATTAEAARRATCDEKAEFRASKRAGDAHSGATIDDASGLNGGMR